MQKILNQLIPFVLLGIAIVAFGLGLMLLAYLFVIGAVVGLVLFIISLIRQKFFPSTTVAKPRKGKTIDSNDWDRL